MKTTNAKTNDNVVRGKLPKIPTGHMPHQSGAGTHHHRCTKRQRTRNAILRRELGLS